jgi:hypothetical protein
LTWLTTTPGVICHCQPPRCQTASPVKGSTAQPPGAQARPVAPGVTIGVTVSIAWLPTE